MNRNIAAILKLCKSDTSSDTIDDNPIEGIAPAKSK